jgi:acetyl-CoA acetyltransferase
MRGTPLDEVVAPPWISGPRTRLQCCPIGEGAAAAIVISEEAIRRYGHSARRQSLRVDLPAETVYRNVNFDAALTQETTAQALAEADHTPGGVDIVELHDAFTVEDLLQVEAMGICPAGHAAAALEAGEFDIGGRVVVSPSGGLLSMGYPIGSTGVGQICGITNQLRGEAGARQHPGAWTGLPTWLASEPSAPSASLPVEAEPPEVA